MNAFESLISMLLRHDGYWTTPSFKVLLTKEEKRQIGRYSSPRWEIDVVAYRGSSNEVLAVECKSFLDSTGVKFRNGALTPEKRYKLFNDATLREVVLDRFQKQLVETGAVRPSPKITLCMAAGKLAGKGEHGELRQYFADNRWRLFDADWILERLKLASRRGYENDVAFVVSKILLKGQTQ